MHHTHTHTRTPRLTTPTHSPPGGPAPDCIPIAVFARRRQDRGLTSILLTGCAHWFSSPPSVLQATRWITEASAFTDEVRAVRQPPCGLTLLSKTASATCLPLSAGTTSAQRAWIWRRDSSDWAMRAGSGGRCGAGGDGVALGQDVQQVQQLSDDSGAPRAWARALAL